MLRSQNEIVSGEDFSAALGISRVSIWKPIHKLQDLGCQILSTSGGYLFDSSPDILFPWEYQGDAANILYYPEVTSTMEGLAVNVDENGALVLGLADGSQ
ncbi:hypothetical protein D1BOALGB6SA_769 [Olavius sp. associated proteobacterium Delta 1]|nr:hypothetical protein D1BOALGB6SA_769 [Olavius sp. associated proteobacterium Delta 1]